MEFLIQILVPADLSIWAAIALVVASFVTAGITTAVGIGGGLAMLALMANILPIAAVVPVHGAVQLANNASRAFLLRKDIVKPILLWFVLGGIVGVTLAGQVVVTLPRQVLLTIMGCFVLFSVWGPKFKGMGAGNKSMFIGGILTAVMGLFIGGSGPIAAGFLTRLELTRQQVIATHATNMVFQHGIKILTFGVLGFVFMPWIGFLAVMLVAGFLGTLAGRAILWHIPEKGFKRMFNMVLTVLALRMLYQAFF